MNLTLAQALQVTSPADQQAAARLLEQYANPDDMVTVWTQALDTAQAVNSPLAIGPFQSVYVANATDILTTVNLRLASKAQQNGSIPLIRKDVLTNDDGPWAGGYLDWTAQAGKTITLIFMKRGKFVSGSQISQISGGTTQSDGSTFTRTVVSLTGAAAVSLFPADSTMIKRSAFNDLGFDLFVGDVNTITDGVAGATSTKGFRWPTGTPLVSQNTGVLYCYNPGVTASVVVLAEK